MVIFNVIFPIFAIALAGYLVAYKGILSTQDVQGLSRFVFKIAFPILLFNSFATMELPEEINWKFMISYYAAALIVFALGMLVNKAAFFTDDKDQIIFGLGSSYSNLVLVGLPILSAGIGDKVLLPLFMIVSIHSATLFSVSTILLERRGENGSQSVGKIIGHALRRMVQNPIVLALILGLSINFLGIKFPAPLADSLALLSRAALPCALFMLGASLTQYKVAGHLAEAATMVGFKMILQPLLVWIAAFALFHIDPFWGGVAVMAAGMPIGVNTYLFAESAEANTRSISAAILLSSIFAIVNQSVLLSIFISSS